MAAVVGVRFKNAGKLYYFDPGKLRPADVNSSDEAFLLKNEHPKSTTPPVNNRNMMISIRCIL